MALNKYQRAVARTFADRAYSYIADMIDDTSIGAAIDATGDRAFIDAMHAIGRPEIDTREKALEALKTALANAETIHHPEPEAEPLAMVA